MSTLASELSGYAFVPEPELHFTGAGLGKHPLMGLIQHAGPLTHSPNTKRSNNSALRGALVYFPVATEKNVPLRRIGVSSRR
jgi:hypothetical protein